MGSYLSRTSKRENSRETNEQINLPPSPASTIPELDENPIFTRLQVALKYMIAKGDSLDGKAMTMRIVTKIMNEALEDMRDAGLHPEVMALYIRQLSAMTLWIADGEWASEIPMPDDFEM